MVVVTGEVYEATRQAGEGLYKKRAGGLPEYTIKINPDLDCFIYVVRRTKLMN